MEKLALLLFDVLLVSFYLLVAFVVFMAVQGLVYWTTGFSIYNFLKKKLITEQIEK